MEVVGAVGETEGEEVAEGCGRVAGGGRGGGGVGRLKTGVFGGGNVEGLEGSQLFWVKCRSGMLSWGWG